MYKPLLFVSLLFICSCATINNKKELNILSSYILPYSCIDKVYNYTIAFESNKKTITTQNKYYYNGNSLFKKTITNFGDDYSTEINEMLVDGNHIRYKEKEIELIINNKIIFKNIFISDNNSGYHTIVYNYSKTEIKTEIDAKLAKEYFSNQDYNGKYLKCYIRKYQANLTTSIDNNKPYVNKQEIIDYYVQDLGLIKKVIFIDNKLNSTQTLQSIE
jgi:predicted ester cyclase